MWVNRFEELKIKKVLGSNLAVLHSDGLKVYEATIELKIKTIGCGLLTTNFKNGN